MSSFLTIGFTSPTDFASPQEEASLIQLLLESKAIDFLHFRKKESDPKYAYNILKNIPDNLFQKIILHSNYNLFNEFPFRGIHINKKHRLEATENAIYTFSAHSLEELKEAPKHCSYFFLSPIFDSISKIGYVSRFGDVETILDEKTAALPIIALGGVTPQHFHKLYHSKFAGAALLGYLWSSNQNFIDKINTILNLKERLE